MANLPVGVPQKSNSSLARVRSEDREFLPAALEILETPPSPVKIGIGVAICSFAALALAWSFIGKLDVYAKAHGRLITETRSSVVQSLVTGKIKSIMVQNGTHVDKGQKLALLDPTEAEADAAASSHLLNDNAAEVTRREAAIAAVKLLKAANASGGSNYVAIDNVTFHGGEFPPETMQREQHNLETDLAQLQSGLANLDQQIAQSQASRAKAEAGIAADQSIIDAQQARLNVQNEAERRKVATKLALYEAQENLARGKAQLATDIGQKAEAEAAMVQLQGQKVKLIDEFIADNQTKITEAARKADDAREQFSKANARLGQMTLVAPIAGTVEELALVSLGQVITSGQQAMTITPDGRDLSAQVYISNADFGFVHEGQEATLKIDAYPFTQYGTVTGHVVRIASDALSEQDAVRLQSKPTSLGNSASYSPTPSAPGQGENLVFPVSISVPSQTLSFRGRDLPLKPGMTVEVEIKTDSRRMIDYLLSPISKITSESMHER